MFYSYFRYFNYICVIVGIPKPFPGSNDSKRVNIILKLWSLTIILVIISSSLMTIDFAISLQIKKNDETQNINEFIVSLIIIFTNVIRKDVYVQLYAIIDKNLKDLKIDNTVVKMFANKLYVWFLIISLLYGSFLIKEILLLDPPFVLILRLPLYLSLCHLYINLCFLLAYQKVINIYMSQIFKLNTEDYLFEQFYKPKSFLRYIVDFDVSFLKVNRNVNFDLKYLCKVYDDLCSCNQLLQKLHSLQIMLTLWLMFSSAVSGVALISMQKTDHPWLEAVKGLLPFFWYSIGCYLDDQLRKQVERTDLIIIKHLIDFRSDQNTKDVLSIFKQAIDINSLQFTAGNLYRINYATMLGTVVSVITYSIMVIQLF